MNLFVFLLVRGKCPSISIGLAKSTAMDLFVLLLISKIGFYFLFAKIACFLEKHSFPSFHITPTFHLNPANKSKYIQL
jgi:hypothetical protein